MFPIKYLGPALALLALFPPFARAAEPPAATSDYAKKMSAALDARKKMKWRQAASLFEEAAQLARKSGTKQEESTARLQAGLALRGLMAAAPDEVTPEDRQRLISCYRGVIDLDEAPAAENELACNNLGVFYLRAEKYDEAVKVFGRVKEPSNPDANVYHYNWGRALQGGGHADEAAAQYWAALEKDPRMTAAADRLLALVLAEKQDRYKKAGKLLDFLLGQADPARKAAGAPFDSGQEQAKLAGTYARKLLAAWEPEEAADLELFPRLLRSYEFAGVGPAEFEAKALGEVAKRDARYKALVAELETLFLDKKLGTRDSPVFRQRHEVASVFPEWAGVWAKSEPARKSFSRLLRRAGDFYFRKSLPAEPGEKKPDPERDGAARQALARYTAAYLLDPLNAEAAVSAVSTASEHMGSLDKGRLLDDLSEAMLGQKGGLKEQLQHHPDNADLWRALFRCHVILARIAEKRGRPMTALSFYDEARKEEAHIRDNFDKGAPPAPWIDARVGRAYALLAQDREAAESYRRAAEGFVRARAPDEAGAALKEAAALVGQVKDGDWVRELLADLAGLRVLNENARKVYPLSSWPLATRAFGAAFHPDDKQVLWGDGKGAAFLAPLGGRAVPLPFPGKANVIKPLVAPDGKWFAGAEGDKIILGTFKGDAERTLRGDPGARVTALAFAPGGRFLASGNQNGTLTLWEFEKEKDNKRWSLAPPSSALRTGAVSLAFSPDGQFLAVALGAKVAVADVRRGKWGDHILAEQGKLINSLSFPSKGEDFVLASGGDDQTVRLWDAGTGKQLAVLGSRGAAVTVVAQSPDGRLLAAGDADGVVVLWDAARHKPLAWLTSARGRVTSVGFDGGGKRVVVGLAASDGRGEVTLWDVSGLSR